MSIKLSTSQKFLMNILKNTGKASFVNMKYPTRTYFEININLGKVAKNTKDQIMFTIMDYGIYSMKKKFTP